MAYVSFSGEMKSVNDHQTFQKREKTIKIAKEKNQPRQASLESNFPIFGRKKVNCELIYKL